MAILSKGTDFSTGDQVTAANLDALVDSATFAAGAVDNTTTALDSSSPQKIIVKDGGIGTTQLATSDSTTTGVTFAKMQHVAANTVLVRDASSTGDISAKAVTNTQILIGDGTGFTAASLSGDVTMTRSEEHTSELQSRLHLVCRLLLEKKKSASDKRNYRV